MAHRDVSVASVWCSTDRDDAIAILQRAGITPRFVRVVPVLPLWEVRVDESERDAAQRSLEGRMTIPLLKVDPRVRRLIRLATGALCLFSLFFCSVVFALVGWSPFTILLPVIGCSVTCLLFYFVLRRPINHIHPALRILVWLGIVAVAWVLGLWLILFGWPSP